jgi:Flp pilus assembly protein TadB
MRGIFEIIGVAASIALGVYATIKITEANKETEAQINQRMKEKAESDLREAEMRYNAAKQSLHFAQERVDAINSKIKDAEKAVKDIEEIEPEEVNEQDSE